uniref:SLAM family member 6 n=1 Tax=Pipistrellus kuhlii TaxID=59472 RepID=A0A7J7UUY5_PIPKU|nr:SLAM family member 6 [Pipistrellus kuhlii]
MIWLLQFLELLSSLGSGITVSQTKAPPLLVNGVLGESVTLPLKFPAKEEIQFITWLHNEAAIIFIQIKPPQTQNTDPQIQNTDPQRKNRLKVIQYYSLQINNLTMEDSGVYRAQITTANSEIYVYNLSIFERLRNLQVANDTQLFGNGTCEIQLTCFVENPDDHVSFRWQAAGNTILEEANLTISWDPKNSSEETYTCIAKNPVSNLSFSLSVQSLCKGSLCSSTQQTQSPAETPRDSGNDPTCPENTVYARVTHPNTKTGIPIPMKNNDSSTIYSVICQPKQPISSRVTVLDNIV